VSAAPDPTVTRWVRAATELESADLPIIGGKGRGLYLLSRLGVPVPAFAIVTTHAYREGVRGGTARLPDGLEAELRAQAAALGGGRFAVRSSATVEDGREGSFSGQFETVLDTEVSKLGAAVLAVWRSAFSERALAARARSGGNTNDFAMAVVLQRQIPATISGVAHTVHLAGERLNEAVISVVAGAGEALVSGESTGETWAVPYAGPPRRLGPPSGEPLLKPGHIEELLLCLPRIEAWLGCPQDIEFAFVGTDLHLLQSRPITASGKSLVVNPLDRPDLTIWDNSNIAESYAGPTSPLTFSFLRTSYANVYRETGQVLGLKPEDVAANESYYQHLLGYFRGRVYYNLASWYQLVLQLPGGEKNARNMERMMGVQQRLPAAAARVPSSSTQLRYGFKLLSLYWKLPALVQEFHRFFGKLYIRYRGKDLASLSLGQLAKVYRDIEVELHCRWTAPIAGDIFCMIFMGLLQELARRYGLEDGGPIVNDLLAAHLESYATRPVAALARMAALIRSREDWSQLFHTATPSDIKKRLDSDPTLAPVRRALDDYLLEFGDRFAGELKLEELPLRENPEWILSVLKGQVALGSTPEQAREKDKARSRAAEDSALMRLGYLRRKVFSWCLSTTRAFIAFREGMRFDRSRLFGLTRDIFRQMGRRLFAAGVLADPQDIFFLSVDECLGYAEGLALTRNLGDLVKVRKEEWDHDRAAPPPPDRFWTVGAAHSWIPLAAADASGPAGDLGPDELSGIGCYPGTVTGEACVVHRPDEPGALAGKILVARSNDPGWVPLYTSVRGILLERGSALSHAANMAREMGIPAILGIPGLLARVKSGDQLRMDARTGRVKILPVGTVQSAGKSDDR
jgi:phosphohistidine swiveling domain-containing protein